MQSLRQALLTCLAFAGILGLLFVLARSNYLLFHSVAEIFALVITVGIFFFAWNMREYLDNNYLLFLGIAYLYIPIIDALHMLSYKGMGVFPWADADLPTQLWIAGRYVGVVALLLAPFTLKRKMNVNLVFGSFALVTGLLLASIFYWKNFPVCYIEGVGLSAFKEASEFLIAFLLLISIGLLWRSREAFARNVLWLLMAGIAIQVGSELVFSDYVAVTGMANMIGHFLRIVSFYLIYVAIIETGLRKPYSILLRRLKQDEAVLQERTEELSRRNEELDAFAHTVAHDLMNPVSSVLIAARSIESVEMDRKTMLFFLKGITDSMNKMSRIIDELLLLSQVRKVDLVGEPIEMYKTVEAAIERLGDMIESSQAQLIFPESWPDAMGYAPWVEEVWVNYISNAIKYGGKPPCIELRASVQPDGTIRFCVQDNGKGLKEEEKERLFKPLSRLSLGRATGHGLGLSIVRRIVEKLDGEVGAESVPGQGSTFSFTLPAVPDDQPEAMQVDG